MDCGYIQTGRMISWYCATPGHLTLPLILHSKPTPGSSSKTATWIWPPSSFMRPLYWDKFPSVSNSAPCLGSENTAIFSCILQE